MEGDKSFIREHGVEDRSCWSGGWEVTSRLYEEHGVEDRSCWSGGWEVTERLYEECGAEDG